MSCNINLYELWVERRFNGGHRRAKVAALDIFKGILRDNQLQRRTSSDEVCIQQAQECL